MEPADVAFRSHGDLELCVEFGDRIDLALNFRVLALDRALKETATPGVRETVPTHRSLGVVYDPIRQLRPGEPVHFRAVDPDEAHDLYLECRAIGGGAELA
jgi:allophanate hydrolase subunit 1